jgi:tetratricopeptide (TPR) repeat protein
MKLLNNIVGKRRKAMKSEVLEMFTKKNVRIAAFIIITIIGSVFNVIAQKSTFEDSNLYDLKQKAETFSDNSVVRVTINEENFDKGDKVPANFKKYINEVIPSDGSNSIYRSRFISEEKTKNGVEREELITIGNQRYIKKNNGNWEVFKSEGSGSGSGSGENIKIETTSENKLQRGVIINNQKTDYYQTTTTYKYFYPTGTIISYTKEGFWFDQKGRYVQTLEESFDGETKNIARKTTVYEYDPNIKIEAPIKINDGQPVNKANNQTSDSAVLAKQYLDSGKTYLDKNDFDSAIKEFTKVIEINPQDFRGYGARGTAYLGKNDLDSAIRDFTKVIEISPQEVKAYGARGIVYSEKKDFDLAIKDFTKALQITSQDAFLYYHRGVAYKNKKDLDSAIKDYSKAIENNPKYPEAYFDRGLAYIDKEDFDLAIKDYTKVIEINPQSDDAYNNRGLAYYAQEKYEQAIADFTKSLQFNNTNIDAYKYRALSYRAVKKNKELGGK